MENKVVERKEQEEKRSIKNDVQRKRRNVQRKNVEKDAKKLDVGNNNIKTNKYLYYKCVQFLLQVTMLDLK